MSKRFQYFINTIYLTYRLKSFGLVFRFWMAALAMFFWVAVYQSAAAHDATLHMIRSDAEHLELTFSLDLITTLQRALAPRVNTVAFLVRYANMSTDEFNDELGKAKLILENDIRIEGPRGDFFTFGPWQWPPSEEIQTNLKRTAQTLLTNPSAIGQMAVLALVTSAHSKAEISRIHLSIGQRLRPILLVQPNIEQFWIDDFSPDAMLDF